MSTTYVLCVYYDEEGSWHTKFLMSCICHYLHQHISNMFRSHVLPVSYDEICLPNLTGNGPLIVLD